MSLPGAGATVITSSTEIAGILALLDAAEASIRALAAEALPPGALLRAERASTEAARAAVLTRTAPKTVDLPPGWAEVVEVDDALDALLARFIDREAPLHVDLARADALPHVPDLPAAVEAEAAADAVLAEAGVATDAAEHTDWAAQGWAQDEQGNWYRTDGAAPQQHWGTEEEPYDPYAAEQGYGEVAETSWQGGSAGYVSFGSSQPTYEQEEYDPYAPEGGAEPAAPAAAPTKGLAPIEEPPADEPEAWHYATQDDDEPSGGRYDPYANLSAGAAAERLLDLDDDVPSMIAAPRPTADLPSASTASSGDYGGGPVDDLHELPSSLIHGELDDELSEPTTLIEHLLGVQAPAGPAAVQLGGPGGPKVVGGEDVDDEGSIIALGSAEDVGEDAGHLPDDGLLGVGAVRYEAEDELEPESVQEEESVLDLASAAIERIPGAPVLSVAEIDALARQARDLAARDMAQGARLWSDVLDADPARADAHVARGRLYLELGDFVRAASDFLKAEDLLGDAPDVLSAQGELYYARKDYNRAISFFDRAIAADAKHAVALSRRGLSYYYRKQYGDALRDLEAAAKLDPSLPGLDTYIQRARKKS